MFTICSLPLFVLQDTSSSESECDVNDDDLCCVCAKSQFTSPNEIPELFVKCAVCMKMGKCPKREFTFVDRSPINRHRLSCHQLIPVALRCLQRCRSVRSSICGSAWTASGARAAKRPRTNRKCCTVSNAIVRIMFIAQNRCRRCTRVSEEINSAMAARN